MPDVYTGTTTLNFDQTAWNKQTYLALRPQLYFDQFATVRGSTYHAGSTVTFPLWADLAAATTPLSEAVDVDAVALADSTMSIPLVEYGNAVIPTAKVRATSYINVDPDVANIVGFNAGISVDTLARTTAAGGTNVRYAQGTATSRATVAAGHTITMADIRFVTAKLRGANVQEFDGNAYAGIIHPDVSYDLRSQTGTNNFSDPVAYSDVERRWNGEVGKVEGVRFMESPRAPQYVDGGATNADVFATIIFGREGIAKAFSTGGGYTGGASPTLTIADKADNLNRFRAVGWKWLGGYGILRQAAVWRIESSSSITP